MLKFFSLRINTYSTALNTVPRTTVIKYSTALTPLKEPYSTVQYGFTVQAQPGGQKSEKYKSRLREKFSRYGLHTF